MQTENLVQMNCKCAANVLLTQGASKFLVELHADKENEKNLDSGADVLPMCC